ncbi:unnamed protein product, partial [Mesorhabditis belari]|uniref:Ferritin n=1 Tax=Mesorhabditis belari TaxID=2138241 RepID=A0AAF3F1Y4_9BILA
MTESQGTSLIRQNYSSDLEAALNKQINIELYASYVYMSMSVYFDRADIALSKVADWMRKQSDEEREHAQKFMKMQNLRGGHVALQPIQKPERDEWGTTLEAFQAALALEKFNNQSLIELHSVASSSNDAQFCSFLEDNFLHEQVESIEEIGKMVTNLKRLGGGMGEYLFEREHFDKS